MLLPLQWLRQFVSVDETPQQVAERFVSLGFETELVAEETLDLEITPNRGDVLSILGLAREYAASTDQSLKMPAVADLTFADQLAGFKLTADPVAYHRLSAVLIKNVANGPSPAWLSQAVESVGMNSIDLIVDLTNYVMFELGIPMHAFDLDQLPAQSFYVRLSTKGEQFVSLKDESLALPENSIVVESGGELVDLLGIRGGKSSMINSNTKNILVWATTVPRPLIRATVKATGLRTEGAYRHERETDWAMVPTALARFVQLLDNNGRVDTAVDMQMTRQKTKKIAFESIKVNKLLGTQFSDEQINQSLERLGFQLESGQAIVPSWRYFDITGWQDLAEEVARIQNYTNIKPQVIETIEKTGETDYARRENLKDQLVEAGFTEVYSESFAGREETKAAGWNLDNLDVLDNPVNRDFAFCRPSILPNLIKILALNAWSDDAKIFELGNIFPNKDKEVTALALATYGKQEKLLSQFVPADSIRLLQPSDPLAQHLKLRRPVTVAELPIDNLKLTLTANYIIDTVKPNYQPVSPFPPAARDLSIIVDSFVEPAEITAVIKKAIPGSVILVELFDQFTSDKFGPNKQSLAYHLVYQDRARTLDTAEVDRLHSQVLAILKERYQAEAR